VPTGTEGYKKAEVTLGGVDTRDLSSQTMESKQPGPVLHRRGGGRDRLAGRLQLPVGLGQRACLRSGAETMGGQMLLTSTPSESTIDLWALPQKGPARDMGFV
jgi:hypothetical protein